MNIELTKKEMELVTYMLGSDNSTHTYNNFNNFSDNANWLTEKSFFIK